MKLHKYKIKNRIKFGNGTSKISSMSDAWLLSIAKRERRIIRERTQYHSWENRYKTSPTKSSIPKLWINNTNNINIKKSAIATLFGTQLFY